MASTDPLIVVDPEILSGVPVFAGTRVPVRTLVDWLTGGYTVAEFLDNFPSVTPEQVSRYLEESGKLILERHGASAA